MAMPRLEASITNQVPPAERITIANMSTLGRFLQIAGLTLPPLSIVLQFGAVKMLASLVFAVCLFLMGRIIEGYARGQRS